jgi:hypothetical protein
MRIKVLEVGLSVRTVDVSTELSPCVVRWGTAVKTKKEQYKNYIDIVT